MTVNRTTLLDLPLPVTGTESGTWGDTTNNGLTQYLDIAIAGTLVLSTDADVTLTSTEGDSSATNIGATTAQYAILRWTATGSTTRNITALAQSKTYVVINATGGTQSIVLRGAGPTTGVTIISGEKAHCVWNGSDFVKVSSSAAAGGSNTQVQYNSSGVLAGSANMTFDGTSLTLANGASIQGLTVGRGAGAVSTNTAVGASALFSNSTGSRNTAVGYIALVNTSGAGSLGNTGVGYAAAANVNGDYNTAVGDSALDATLGGSYNTAIGADALTSNTTASYNTAVGFQSARYQTGATNTFVGTYSGSGVNGSSTGGANSALGYGSLSGLTTGSNNTAIGQEALQANTTASNNTAVGYQAAYSSTTTSQMTAVGFQALYTGSFASTAVGYQAGYSNNSNFNTYLGYLAGNGDVSSGSAFNVFVGAEAGRYYGAAANNNNTAVGGGAMQGSSTVANNTGTANAAFGASAMVSLTSGSNNVAVGSNALRSNTTASNNTAVGYQAGYSNTTGGSNVFIGRAAGYASTGNGNLFVGYYAGNASTGTGNTFLGSGNAGITYGSGELMTTGSKNTILGNFSGNQGGLDIRTANNYIVLSDGDGNPRAICTTAGAWYFYNTGGAGSDVVNSYSGAAAGPSRSLFTGWYGATSPTAGTLSFNVTTNGDVTNTNNSYGAISDIKLKENIVDASPKLDDMMRVRIVNFNFKSGQTHKQIGVIAQELEQVFPGMVEEVPDTDIDGNDLGTTTKQVKYSVFVPMLVKAIQELKTELDSVKAELATLKGA